MNKLLSVVFVGCLLGGCAQQVYLKKSPSELVLTSIKSENQKKVAYTFTSKIPDTLAIGNFLFDVNATYVSNLKIYMNTKYTIAEGDSTKVEFILLSCGQKTQDANSGMQTTSNVLTALAGKPGDKMYSNILLITEINLKVIVKKGTNVLSEKSIFTTDEYNGNKNDISVAASSFDQAIGKSIIMIDKFLSTIEKD
jgi:hypothetical protein